MTLEIGALMGMGLVVLWGGIVLLLAFKPWKKNHTPIGMRLIILRTVN